MATRRRLTGATGAGLGLLALATSGGGEAGAGAAPAGVCGTYDLAAEFEADYGPFRRDLFNLEDFELTNAPPQAYCVIDGAEVVDCSLHADASGLCPGPALDPGDVLPGISIDAEPPRGAGWWELLVQGGSPGYTRSISANYFGDGLPLSLPVAPLPVGCERPAPGPNLVGLDTLYPGSLAVRLADGSSVNVPVGPSGFAGVCCDQEILSVGIGVGTALGGSVDNIRWGAGVCLRAPDREVLFRGAVLDLASGWQAAALPLGDGNDGATSPFPAATSLGGELVDTSPPAAPLVLYRLLLADGTDAGPVLRATESAAAVGAVELGY